MQPVSDGPGIKSIDLTKEREEEQQEVQRSSRRCSGAGARVCWITRPGVGYRLKELLLRERFLHRRHLKALRFHRLPRGSDDSAVTQMLHRLYEIKGLRLEYKRGPCCSQLKGEQRRTRLFHLHPRHVSAVPENPVSRSRLRCLACSNHGNGDALGWLV